jgi:2,3-diketo-5-methylthio-1-phosphopentane phosphatase
LAESSSDGGRLERPPPRLAVFVDYDGTITDRDTFDVLVRQSSSPEQWAMQESHLHDGSMSLRDVLAAQARSIRGTIEQADALLARTTTFDPAFAAFARRCEFAGIPLVVLSSGVQALIERALQRNGLGHLPVLANSVVARSDGWCMHFRDASDNGHDKAAAVRAARADGTTVVFAGDGYSDFAAAREADRRFAKRGRALEGYLRKNGVGFTPFVSFAEIAVALFG